MTNWLHRSSLKICQLKGRPRHSRSLWISVGKSLLEAYLKTSNLKNSRPISKDSELSQTSWSCAISTPRSQGALGLWLSRTLTRSIWSSRERMATRSATNGSTARSQNLVPLSMPLKLDGRVKLLRSRRDPAPYSNTSPQWARWGAVSPIKACNMQSHNTTDRSYHTTRIITFNLNFSQHLTALTILLNHNRRLAISNIRVLPLSRPSRCIPILWCST